MDLNLLENKIVEECPYFKETYNVPNFWSVVTETINGEYSEYTKKIIQSDFVVRETKKNLQSKSINFVRLNPNQQYLECLNTFLILIVNILERIKHESKTFRDILENKYILKTFLQYMAEKYTDKPEKQDIEDDSSDDDEELFDAKMEKGGKSNRNESNKKKSKRNKPKRKRTKRIMK